MILLFNCQYKIFLLCFLITFFGCKNNSIDVNNPKATSMNNEAIKENDSIGSFDIERKKQKDTILQDNVIVNGVLIVKQGLNGAKNSYRIYIPKMSYYGACKWIDIPINTVLEKLKEIDDSKESLWVEIKCDIKRDNNLFAPNTFYLTGILLDNTQILKLTKGAYFIIDKNWRKEYLNHKTNEIYTPEPLEDDKPAVKGDFWEIANNSKINLKQKALVEAITRGQNLIKGFGPSALFEIEGLGITDLYTLKGLNDGLIEYGGKVKPVTSLFFCSTLLNDISILLDFKDLTSLTIRGSEVQDFSPISNLSNLKFLDISFSKAKDLKALKNLTSLEELTLDSESNLDTSDIKELLMPHLNNQGVEIKLKIKYDTQKRKLAPDEIGFNESKANITPTIVGKFNFKYTDLVVQNPKLLLEKSNLIHNPSQAYSGELIFYKVQYEINISIENNSLNQALKQKGVYSTKGNLIFFQPENGKDYICSFYWDKGLKFYLIDRFNFQTVVSVVNTFKKISN